MKEELLEKLVVLEVQGGTTVLKAVVDPAASATPATGTATTTKQ